MPKRKIARTTAKATVKKAVATKRRRSARNAAGTTLPWLRSASGEYRFQPTVDQAESWSRELQQAAMQWTYIVRNRQRWRGLPDSVKTQSERARKLLMGLGLTAADLDAIAGDGMVEVVVPYRREEEGWEARIFPWEYVLAAATREARRGQPLTVVRRLQTSTARAVRRPSALRVLYVESAPGQLRQDYSFDTERALVQTSLKPKAWKELLTPTLAQLQSAVTKFKPDVVHLAGFDSHQGLLLLGEDHDPNAGDPAAAVPDGYLLASESGKPAPVAAIALAQALCSHGHRPQLVALNLQNSAARVAPLLIAEGAGAAIGFQDIFDDDLSELFLATFYRELRHGQWHLAAAFDAAWAMVRQRGTALQGSGLVLWSSQPLLEQAVVAPAPPKPGLLLPADVPPAEARQIVTVDISPLEELNYSLLHNQQPLFERFSIFNGSAAHNKADRLDSVGDVDVSVELSAGTETACYSRLLTVDGTNVDLKKDVHVPLTSALLRSVGEAINSTMTIRVSWGQMLYHESHKVRLLPVDQWRDNDRDGQWLPSFVLPRDPAVERLVEKAQRYVRVLRDDPSAGFEGYQAVEARAADPTAEVDRQVQAIWSTIVHELDLGYINPPPSYSNALDSQRLRRPSTIERWRSGTCLDLALLLASCLELVDIYPVVFLLKDHAFPGYWRNDAYQEAFIDLTDESPSDAPTEELHKTKVPGAQPVPWWFRKSAYDEILKQVRLGRLVPLESVWLTEHSGFWDAVDGGKDNLKDRNRFHSMLDIARARDENVTPLPIGGDA
jgi:hypothetical protein